jgi:hypothetical protein
MKILKLLLGAIALFFAVWLGFAVIGLVYGLLFYVVVAAVLGGAGYAGYKLLTRKDTAELNPYNEISQIEPDNFDSVKQLDELKKKYLK